MNITVRAFASYREAIGHRQMAVEVVEGATAGQVWETLSARYPGLRLLPHPSAFAINDQYVPSETVLREQDELVLIPPVSGGEAPVEPTIELVSEPIDITRLIEKVRHPRAGAVVVFLGTVRDNRHGQRVEHLEYEAYQAMARREMGRVAAEATRRWPLLGIALSHRLGTLQVGDISVAIVVASPHRADAFEAGRFAIDTLKRSVPIWKKEVWEGGAVWVGSEPRD